MSWTESVFNCLLLIVVWSRIAPFPKGCETAWLNKIDVETFCSDEVGTTLLEFTSFELGSVPVHLKEQKKKI